MPTPSLFRPLACWLALLVASLLPAAEQTAPEKWAKEIDTLTAADVNHAPPADSVVFVGSSSIRLWKSLAQDFPGITTINRGFGGSELADSVYYVDRIVLPYRPRLVVLFAGTNDLKNGKTPAAVFADFQAFKTKLHAGLPAARLIYIAITYAPSRVHLHEQMRETNRLIAADCARDPRCTFVDINPFMGSPSGAPPRPELFVADQLHLNPAGYAIWTKVLAPYLKP